MYKLSRNSRGKNQESINSTASQISSHNITQLASVQSSPKPSQLPGFLTLMSSTMWETLSVKAHGTKFSCPFSNSTRPTFQMPETPSAGQDAVQNPDRTSPTTETDEEKEALALTEVVAQEMHNCAAISDQRPLYASTGRREDMPGPLRSHTGRENGPRHRTIDARLGSRRSHARKEQERRAKHKLYLNIQYQMTSDVALTKAGVTPESTKHITTETVLEAMILHAKMLSETIEKLARLTRLQSSQIHRLKSRK